MPGTALENPTFQPAMRLITALSIAATATVTTSFDHDYLVGLVVRLLIPSEFGMIQVNQELGTIIDVPTTDSFVIDIDTRGFDTFIIPVPEEWFINDFPSVVPVGEVNSSLRQATRNVL